MFRPPVVSLLQCSRPTSTELRRGLRCRRFLKIPGHFAFTKPRPPNYSHAGDLETAQPPIPLETPRPIFANSALLKDAPPAVRRICSMEFGRPQDVRDYWVAKLSEPFARYPGEFTSAETKIAIQTAFIRSMIPITSVRTQNKVLKMKTLEAIDKRRQLMKKLRTNEYVRFQYVSKTLRVRWAPASQESKPTEDERTIKEATDAAEGVRNAKRNELKEKYSEELAQLRAEKAELLAKLSEELSAVGINSVEQLQEESAKLSTNLSHFTTTWNNTSQYQKS